MTVTKVVLTKNYKCGLPNYSNVTTGITMEWEIKEGEEFLFDKAWDTINRQLHLQGDGTDQAWMHIEDLKHETKVTIKVPKQEQV